MTQLVRMGHIYMYQSSLRHPLPHPLPQIIKLNADSVLCVCVKLLKNIVEKLSLIQMKKWVNLQLHEVYAMFIILWCVAR